MAVVLISWGTTKPDQALVDLMLQKASAFHVVSSQVKLVFGHRWPKADGTAADYDLQCWHIRDDGCTAGAGSHGLEGCRGLLEGLQEGYELAKTICRAYCAPKKRVRTGVLPALVA